MRYGVVLVLLALAPQAAAQGVYGRTAADSARLADQECSHSDSVMAACRTTRSSGVDTVWVPAHRVDTVYVSPREGQPTARPARRGRLLASLGLAYGNQGTDCCDENRRSGLAGSAALQHRLGGGFYAGLEGGVWDNVSSGIDRLILNGSASVTAYIGPQVYVRLGGGVLYYKLSQNDVFADGSGPAALLALGVELPVSRSFTIAPFFGAISTIKKITITQDLPPDFPFPGGNSFDQGVHYFQAGFALTYR